MHGGLECSGNDGLMAAHSGFADVQLHCKSRDARARTGVVVAICRPPQCKRNEARVSVYVRVCECVYVRVCVLVVCVNARLFLFFVPVLPQTHF